MASVAQAAEIPEKNLYRIGEVSRLTATKAFVLRYWESEFPSLQPVKSPAGHRLYRREDIETVFKIKQLLYEEGFTIAGARKHLAEHNNGSTGPSSETNGGTNGHRNYGEMDNQPGAQPTSGQNNAPRQIPMAVAATPAPPQSAAASEAHQKLLRELRDELQAVLTLLERE